jgi:hypothetical protein
LKEKKIVLERRIAEAPEGGTSCHYGKEESLDSAFALNLKVRREKKTGKTDPPLLVLTGELVYFVASNFTRLNL